MKKFYICFSIVVLLILFISANILAAVSSDTIVPGEEPVLITNAGQGPGGKMGRLLVSRSGAVEDYDYNAEPWEEDLQAKPYKTLLVIMGSSAKGLGASGITIDDEIDRLEKMITEAKRLEMKIVAALIEGKTRRGNPGSANERSIEAIAPFADYLIVMEDGNQDGLFTRIAEEKEIPLTLIDNTIDFIEVIKMMFTETE